MEITMGFLDKYSLEKRKTSSNTEKLSPMDKLISDIDDQIKLTDSNKVSPQVSVKENGKVKKNEKNETVMKDIKSWFDDKGQFTPTPSGMNFFDIDGLNSIGVGDVNESQKLGILNEFREGIKNGDMKDNFDDWNKRNSNRFVPKNKK
jgi:hypothetical protein